MPYICLLFLQSASVSAISAYYPSAVPVISLCLGCSCLSFVCCSCNQPLLGLFMPTIVCCSCNQPLSWLFLHDICLIALLFSLCLGCSCLIFICLPQCCGAGPFLTGSGIFFSPAPTPAPIKSRLWTIEIFFKEHTYFLTTKQKIHLFLSICFFISI